MANAKIETMLNKFPTLLQPFIPIVFSFYLQSSFKWDPV